MQFLQAIVYLLTMICAVATASPPAAAQATPKMKATLAVAGSSSQISLLAFNVATTRGYFKEAGLDLQSTDVGSGAKGLQALMANNVDMVAGVYEHTIRMQAKGIPLRAFVLHSNAPGIVIGVTKTLADKYTGVKDLKGAKIGVSSPGSATHLLLNQLLTRNGLKPEDVSAIAVGNAAGAVAAVRSGGELQAIVNYDPVISELEQTGDIKVIVDTRTLEATRAFYNADFAFLSTYAHADFLDKNPEAAAAVATGLVRALLWMRTASDEEILAAVPETYWNSNRNLYLATIKKNRAGFSPDGLITELAAKTVYDGLVAYDKEVQGAKIDLAKTYDNRFVMKALERYRKP